MSMRIRQDLKQIQDQQSPDDFHLTTLKSREHEVIKMRVLDERAAILKTPGPCQQNVQQQLTQIQIWGLNERVVEIDEIEMRTMDQDVLKREIAVAVSGWNRAPIKAEAIAGVPVYGEAAARRDTPKLFPQRSRKVCSRVAKVRLDEREQLFDDRIEFPDRVARDESAELDPVNIFHREVEAIVFAAEFIDRRLPDPGMLKLSLLDHLL